MRITLLESSKRRRAILSIAASLFLLASTHATGTTHERRLGAPAPTRQADEREDVSPRRVRRPGGFKKFTQRFLDFLSCRKANVGKKLDLLRYGPEFPESYDPSDFSIKALVGSSRPMALEYKLEQQSSVTVTVQVMNAEPFTQTFTGGGMDEVKIVRFTLPTFKVRGPRPLPEPYPARISFKATRDGSRGKTRAEFRLLAIGAGEDAIVTLSRRPSLDEVASLGALPHAVAPGSLSRSPAKFCSFSSVQICGVAFLEGANGYNYAFSVGNNFNAWGVDIVRSVRNETMEWLRKQQLIGPYRNPLHGVWDGRTNGRKVRAGQYAVRALVWKTVAGNANWATSVPDDSDQSEWLEIK